MAASTTQQDASVTAIAITTLFTPASSCGSSHLTQLSSPGYEIWFAEPIPVPSSTALACYPSDWIDNYTSTGSSSIVPFATSLVCPSGWDAVYSTSSSYVACCPSSYELAYPSSTVDTARPAYGGTCYSNLALGQTLTVTAYNSASVTATAQWIASVSGAQVYAHPIDGYLDQIGTTSRNTSTSATSSASATAPISTSASITSSTTLSSTPAATSVSSTAQSHELSGGAVAGIVIGVVAGIFILAVAAALCLRQRRRRGDGGRPPAYSAEASKDNAVHEASTAPKEAPPELSGEEKPFELQSAPELHELESPEKAHHNVV